MFTFSRNVYKVGSPEGHSLKSSEFSQNIFFFKSTMLDWNSCGAERNCKKVKK